MKRQSLQLNRIAKVASLALLFALLPLRMLAQEVIVTNDGDAKKVFNVEVSGQSIFYTLTDKAGAAIQKMNKSNVLMIKHRDGTKEVFTGETEKKPIAAVAPAEAAGITGQAPEEDRDAVEKAKTQNKEVIAAWNNDVVTCKDKKLGGKSNYYYFQFVPTSSSVLVDKNMEISFKMTEGWWGGELSQRFYSIAILKNKTDKTIYVDLGNSFFIRSGKASAYYIPGATSKTNESSSGAGVNLGAVAGALGVGGALGTLAGGVNVGGGSASSSSTVTYNQRVIAIPPMSNCELPAMELFPVSESATYENRIKTSTFYKHGHDTSFYTLTDQIMKEGQTVNYNEDNAPLKFGSFLTYSFDENITQPKSLKFDFYSSRAIGLQHNSWAATNYSKHLSDNYARFYCALVVNCNTM
jgi:hypothetical protein